MNAGLTQSLPLTPSYTSPRTPPPDPSRPSKHSKHLFSRTPPRSIRSLASFHSNHSSISNYSDSNSTRHHPYAAMLPAPVPVVSSRDALEDEDECPVCLEPLSFSFRLPGEKPHIVPECGHALHEACFSAVYGPPPSQVRTVLPRKTNLGVCGVCRRPMKVADGDGAKKSNKLAALTGVGDRNNSPVYSGRDQATIRARGQAPPPRPYDPNEDDPIEHSASVRGMSGPDLAHYIVSPSIQVRSEFSSLTRTTDASQPLTSIIIVELPGKRATGNVHGGYAASRNGTASSTQRQERSANSSPMPEQQLLKQRQQRLEPSDMSYQQPTASMNQNTDQYMSPSNEERLQQPEEENPFAAITEDLRNRIIDWKGHPLSDLGPLLMYDLLSVRRDALVREFFVYLFKEAIICVVEEKKRSLGRLLSNASAFSDNSSAGRDSLATQSRGVLRLKGRIYVRHIKQVKATSAAGEMSLTIDMEDELASFILIFKDRSSLESWKNQIQSQVRVFQDQKAQPQQPEPSLDIEEFGGSAKAARILNGTTVTTATMADSILNGSGRSTLSSATSHHGSIITSRHGHKLAPLEEDQEITDYESPSGLVTVHTSSGPSNSLAPVPHPPLDLILVVSIPPASAPASSAALKLRVIKTTLDFILASMGAKDRLSLVTFEVGIGGHVRRTPFLNIGKTQSRLRLGKFIDETGYKEEGFQDEFLVRASKDEKTDVVTAVNHGLDVVLQRKSRNPVSGMLLVSDASDTTRRAQMDLVLARAEAANVPIHSFGYGRSHDPASLWLMSNHTNGTYTFVKDWYDLRDCVAGCVGGMMSIGLLNMKLHIKVVDSQRFRIRKVSGGPSSILASDGQNVDIDIGELRYGERKEMLIELDLDNTDLQRRDDDRMGQTRQLNATDQFVQSMGLDSLSIEDSTDLVDGMMDRMIDEMPVVEVDGSFFDPAAGKHVSRLAHPVLLTVTLLPISNSATRPQNNVSDPVIVRRRMELLASDMITRALVLVSRKNFSQAQKILGETKRILHTVLQTISRVLPPPNNNGGTMRNRKELMTLSAVRAMQAILQDLQILSEALDENVELFGHDQRNFGAQQAMILRDQKSWSGRSATERLFWTTDNSIALVTRSSDWIARE